MAGQATKRRKDKTLINHGTNETRVQAVREMNIGRMTEQKQTGKQAVKIKQEVLTATEKDTSNTRKADQT